MKTQNKDAANSFYNPPLLKLITLATIIYMLYYIWWRCTNTLNYDAPIFSWTLIVAEAFGVVSYIFFSWMTMDISPKRLYQRPRRDIKVDIFIPTYNEDLEILEATLVGCQGIKYPHSTYLLDDGNRPEAKALALRLNVNYIARPTHEHAKAGNINYALSQSYGEFIVILDADMVPQPNYLDRTLGYFEDEKLALIQLPQEFYNSQDSIQHSSQIPSWHEQALFFRVIQPGKNYSESAFWCGSPSIVRRKALEDIGRVATETITEDIHTTVRLHSRGWQTYFLNEPLAYGIAPQTIRAFLLQRLRWAQGTMQLYRSKESPLWISGLSMQQRLSYLSSFLAYFESFQKFILILTPVFILTLGIFPMNVDVNAFLIRWIPYFLLNFISNHVSGRGIFRYFSTEKFNLLKMIVFIQSTLTLVSKKNLDFKVTPKSVDSSVYKSEIKALRLYMIIAAVLTGSMFFGLLQIFSLHTWPFSFNVFFIAFFWAGYNQIIILLALSRIFEKYHNRAHYRFSVHLHADIINENSANEKITAQVKDLSLSGAGLILQNKIPVGFEKMYLSFAIPGKPKLRLPIRSIHYHSTSKPDKVIIGISFKGNLNTYRAQLFEYLFVILPPINLNNTNKTLHWNLQNQPW